MDVIMYQCTFQPSGNPTAQIRRDLADAIRSADEVDPAWLYDVLLVVTELVTNVCLHAGTSGEVVVTRGDGVLAIDVADRTPTSLPLPRMGPVTAPSGRGLGIVEQLTSSCAVDVGPEWKCVRVQVPIAHPPAT